MDPFVALTADDERLATARCHHLDPPGWGALTLASPVQVLQMSHVMDLDLLPGATELAGVGQ